VYRQGDILIMKIAKIPKTAKEVAKIGEKIVLAYGESTGHTHAIVSSTARLYAEPDDGNRYLTLTKSCLLEHDTHRAINLQAGNYRIVIQREYTSVKHALASVED